uniref:Secreted protein n=1 Tax=Setaria italica TaxID=4555 RepID=K4AJG1_SETIT
MPVCTSVSVGLWRGLFCVWLSSALWCQCDRGAHVCMAMVSMPQLLPWSCTAAGCKCSSIVLYCSACNASLPLNLSL